MFSIPNTSIPFQTYDVDAGRTPAAQSWFFSQPIVSGYLFCSTQPVFVRLSVGSSHSQMRRLPEFFLPPGAQGMDVDYKSGGNPVWGVEVRAASAVVPQFWGALATATDPVGGFVPASYAVDVNGSVVPVVITLEIEQDGAGVGTAQILDLTTVAGVGWSPVFFAGNQINLPVPPVGVQIADAGQVNEVIIDFENATGLAWSQVDDAANHRTKVTAKPSRRLALTKYTSDVIVASTVEATGTVVVTSASFTPDGATPVKVEFYYQRLASGTVATQVTICLWRDGVPGVGTELGRIGAFNIAANSILPGGTMEFTETPTNAAHTYTVAAFASAITGNPVIGGGAGGVATSAPGFIRVSYDY